MTPLGINPRSVEWRAVLDYISKRRAELIEEAIDLGLTREQRDAAAARIAELDELKAAPLTTRELAEAEAAGRELDRSVY